MVAIVMFLCSLIIEQAGKLHHGDLHLVLVCLLGDEWLLFWTTSKRPTWRPARGKGEWVHTAHRRPGDT
jgi:hypothetical protein